MTRSALRAALVTILAMGCRATTGRPSFVPFPEAEHAQIGFDLAGEEETIFMVTDTLAARLRADSIPLNRVRRFDGFIESLWFDAKTLQPLSGRPLGPNAVKVRAWVDPGQPGFSRVELETVLVPRVDPSLSDREQEAPVPTAHPINRRMGELLKKLAATYGVPTDEKADSTPTRLPAPPAPAPPPPPASPSIGA